MPDTRVGRTGRVILSAPLFAIAVVWVVVNELFRAVVVPAVNGLVRLRPLQRLEAFIAALPPYAILALFVIPLAVIEPFKIYGLYLIGSGHVIMGVLAFVAAKVVGVGLAERLFAIGRDKLLSIGWFKRIYDKCIAIKDAVHAYLVTTRFWPAFVRALEQVKASFRSVRVRSGEGLRAAKAWIWGSRAQAGPVSRRVRAVRGAMSAYFRPPRSAGIAKAAGEPPLEAAHPSLSDWPGSPSNRRG